MKPVAWPSDLVGGVLWVFLKHLSWISSVTAWVLLGQLWSGLKYCINVVISLSSLLLPKNPNFNC